MATPEILAVCFIVLLSLFTAVVGVMSLVKGRVMLAPGGISRKEKFGLWLMGVFVQLVTAAGLLFFCYQLYNGFSAGR